MNVSARGQKAQASPIRRLAPYADQAVKSGATVYYLKEIRRAQAASNSSMYDVRGVGA